LIDDDGFSLYPISSVDGGTMMLGRSIVFLAKMPCRFVGKYRDRVRAQEDLMFRFFTLS
jgi:hypothetical protein